MPLKLPLLLLAVAAAVSSPSSATAATAGGPDTVTVFRCCSRGETIDPDAVDGRCVALPASEPQDFVPVIIYDPSNSQFLAPNATPPPYWDMVQSRPPCRPSTFLRASPLDAPSGYVQFTNGSLWVQQYSSVMVDPGQYCLDRGGALVCQPEEPDKTKKCCGPRAAYSELKTACDFWHPHEPADLPADVASGFPRCDGDTLIMSGRINVSHWPVDGVWPAGGKLRTVDGATLRPQEYCLEHVIEEPERRSWTVFTCAPAHDVTKSYRADIRFTLYPLGLLLSAFFLAVTLVASCMLPSTYHVLHWKCQVNHVGCLLVGDLCLAFVQLSGDNLQGPLCVFTGTTRTIYIYIYLKIYFTTLR